VRAGPLWELFKYTFHGRKLVDKRKKRTGVVSHRAWHQLDATGVEPHKADRYVVRSLAPTVGCCVGALTEQPLQQDRFGSSRHDLPSIQPGFSNKIPP
jgi:hypothetical protein